MSVPKFTVYRNPDVPEKPKACGVEWETYCGDGKIVRNRQCPVPGWWDRLFARCQVGDRWCCNACKAFWIWGGNQWTPE